MARLRTWGGEWNSPAADWGGTVTAGVTTQTGTVRTGTYAHQLTSNGTNTARAISNLFTSANDVTYYARAYVRWDGNPARNFKVLGFIENLSNVQIGAVFLTTAGNLRLLNHSSLQIGSDITGLSANTWYRLEMSCLVPSAGTTTTWEVRVDGTTGVTGTDTTHTANAVAGIDAGDATSTSLAANLFIDDVAVNDSTGSFQNSWPGAGSVLLSIPTADSQVGSWTGSGGGTTNLFDAVNNVPPTGQVSGTNSTQIKTSDSTGNNSTDEYRATMQSYTAAGYSSGTLVVGQAHVLHAEEAAAGTKTGSLSLASNPASGAFATFTYGDNIGALGAYPTNWRTFFQNGQDISGVTAGTAPVVNVRKTDANATVSSVAGIGIYFEYIPVTNTTVTPGTATLTITTFAPTVTATNNKTATPGTATLSLSTFAPTVSVSDNKTVTPGTATLSLTTFAPTASLSDNKTVTPGTAALALTTFAPSASLSDNKTVTPGTASLTLATFAPTASVSNNQLVTPATATLSLSTFAPVVTASDNKTVVPDPAALALTAFPPTVTATDLKTVTPGTAALVITTFAPTVTATDLKTVTPGTAALTLTTYAPTVTATTSVDTTVTPGTVALTLTAFAPTVTASDHKTVTPGTASLSLTAFAPNVVLSDQKVVTPGTRALVLTTFAPTVHATANVTVTPATRALHLTTYAPHAVTPVPGKHLDLAMSIQTLNVDNAAALLQVGQSVENAGPVTSKDDLHTTLTMGDSMTVDLSYE